MTITLAELAASGSGGVFRCHGAIVEPALVRAAGHNLQVVPIRLEGIRDKNAFLNALAGALRCPDYFGHNWDALYDCLLDLPQESGMARLLVLRGASAFARAEPEEFAAAVAALQDAAEYWEGTARRLLVVIGLDTPALAPDLAEISAPAM